MEDNIGNGLLYVVGVKLARRYALHTSATTFATNPATTNGNLWIGTCSRGNCCR